MLSRLAHAIFDSESFWRRVVRYGALWKHRDPVAWLEFRHVIDVECALRREPKQGLRKRLAEEVFPEIVGKACRMFHMRPTVYSLSWEELNTVCQIAAALAPRSAFEFGTFDGRTTAQLALNTPADAVIYTLDIQAGNFEFGANASTLRRCRVGERVHESGLVDKVHFLTGDSRQIDLSAYDQTMDLVFVDADHSYGGVLNDSAHAFRMVRPGGTIIWHDYLLINDVTQALIELGKTRSLVNIEGTSLVVWRDKTGDGGMLHA